MNRPWELTIDNSYEEGYALGLQEARAQVIKYMYEDGDTVEEIAALLCLSTAAIMSYTASIYALQ